MDITNNNTTGRKAHEIQEIDLLELAMKVWKSRKLILKVCGIGAIVGLIIGFSTPKEYTTEILIAPESTTGKSASSSSMSSLAAMAGISLGTSTARDAIYPDLYPEIVASTPFLVGLFDIPIHEQQDTTLLTLATYMKERQKVSWIKSVTGAPFRLIGWAVSLFRDKPDEAGTEAKIDPFQLTKEQAGVAGGISSRIQVTVEKKTWVTTLAVTMQDPLVAAVVADSVRKRLQEYVTEYRTSKARTTLEYTEKLYREAQAEYYTAQAQYAEYADKNQGLSLLSSKAELEKLQNEKNLAFSAYNQMSQQLRMAKAKVDEITPVYTIIQPASVPLRASKPRKMMILVGCVFLCGVGSVGWVLFLQDLWGKRTFWRKKQQHS